MVDEHPLIGKVLAGDYKIIAFLGKGGMGSVFVAEQIALNRQVAIKLLPVMEMTPEESMRFEFEIATMSTLVHPNIVTIHSRGKFGEPPSLYYVMELLEGGSLKNYLQKFGKIPPPLALRLIRPVAEALSFAHEQGCIHRDIKPDNLLFTKNYRCLKIADFGIAKLTSGISITHSQAMIGTFLYAAPEQMLWFEDTSKPEGAPIDARADQYSLGIVLYEMVTGQLPYRARNLMEMMKALSEAPIPPSEAAGYKISRSLEWLLSTMIAKSRENRFLDDDALLDAFSSVELELTASVSTRIFSLKPQEQGSIPPTASFPIASQSEKLFMQSQETKICIPERSWWDKYQKILAANKTVIRTVCGVLSLLVFVVILFSIWPKGTKENGAKVPDNDPKVVQQPPKENPENTPVSLRIFPAYLPVPPPDYPPLSIIFISPRGLQQIQLEDSIAPGAYQLSVLLPGYTCQEHGRTIEVRPGRLFHLTLTLNATPRKVSPKIVDSATRKDVVPIIFHIDNQPVAGNRFLPGEHHIYAVLENHQAIDTVVQIPPASADDIFQYEASLVPLRDILVPVKEILALASKIRRPDGSAYELEILVDEQKQPFPNVPYQFHRGEMYACVKVAPNAQKVLLRLGPYYNMVPIEQIHAVRSLDKIDVGMLMRHFAQIKDKQAFVKELESFYDQNKTKIVQFPPDVQQKFYQFLVEHTAPSDTENLDTTLWELRRLSNASELEEYESFKTCSQKLESLSFSERGNLWQAFIRKYPQGVYHKQALSFLEYNKEAARYEQLFREYVRECFLSLSEKRSLQRLESKLRAEDISLVKKRIHGYLKELRCGQSLEELMRNP